MVLIHVQVCQRMGRLRFHVLFGKDFLGSLRAFEVL